MTSAIFSCFAKLNDTEMPPKYESVLIVSAEQEDARLIEVECIAAGIPAHYVLSSIAAMQSIHEICPTIILLDLHMPANSAFDLVDTVRRDTTKDLVVLVGLSLVNDEQTLRLSRERGLSCVLSQPLNVPYLLRDIKDGFFHRAHEFRKENFLAEMGYGWTVVR